MLTPFDFQTEAIEDIREKFRGGAKRVLFVAPMSSGKTATASILAILAVNKGKRLLFITPRITLLDQTYKDFISAGLSTHVIHSEYKTMPSQVMLSTPHTLRNKLKTGDIPHADIVVVDEAHAQLASSVSSRYMLASLCDRGAIVIGLTATPFSKGLGRTFPEFSDGRPLFDAVSHTITYQTLRDAKRIVPIRIYVPSVTPTKGIKTQRNEFGETDYSPDALDEIMSGKAVIAHAIEHWRAIAPGAKTIVFTPGVLAATEYCRSFLEQGFKADLIHGYMSRENQIKAIERFKSNDTEVLVNPLLLREGLNVTDIECILWLRPTRSETLWRQAAGRGMRVHPGKDHFKLIDCTGTALTLGRPDSEFVTLLDDGKPKEAKATDSKPEGFNCKSCLRFLEPKERYPCPHCGFKPVTSAEVKEYEGTLIELGQLVPRETDPTKRLLQEHGKRMYSWLEYIRMSRGYKVYWTERTMSDLKIKPFKSPPSEPPPEALKILNLMINKRLYRHRKMKGL